MHGSTHSGCSLLRCACSQKPQTLTLSGQWPGRGTTSSLKPVRTEGARGQRAMAAGRRGAGGGCTGRKAGLVLQVNWDSGSRNIREAPLHSNECTGMEERPCFGGCCCITFTGSLCSIDATTPSIQMPAFYTAACNQHDRVHSRRAVFPTDRAMQHAGVPTPSKHTTRLRIHLTIQQRDSTG